MEFQDYASRETAGLLTQLLAGRSDASVQHLRTIRDALDAATRALESPPLFDRDVDALVARLTQAAADDVWRVQEEARAANDATRQELSVALNGLNAAQADLNAARSELSDLAFQRDRLQNDLFAQQSERQRLENALAETHSAGESLRADIQAERERADAADRDLSVTVEAHTELETEFRRVEGECRKLETECRRLEGEWRKSEAAAWDAAQAKGAVDEQVQEVRGLLDLALAEAARLQAQLDQQATDRAATDAETAALRDELSALREAYDRLDTACTAADAAARTAADATAAADAARQDTQAQLDMALAETAQVRSLLDAETSSKSALQWELNAAADVRSERDAIEAQRATMATELDATRNRVFELETAQAQQEDDHRALQDQLDQAMQSEAGVRAQAADLERQRSGVSAEADALRGDVDRMVSLIDASVRAVDELGDATTITDLLGALVSRLSSQFTRVALFRVKGNRLEGEHHIGFDHTTDVTKLVIPLSLDSLLTRVVSSGTIERLTGDELAERGGTPFGGAPFSAIALPLAMKAETLAVIYAEHEDLPASAAAHESSIGFARLLAAQTTVLLMRHTQELKMLAELREYATMLLQEAEHMYAADAEAGKTSEELRKRLKDNLDCARQLYSHRAAMEGPAAAMLFEEHIGSAIEASGAFAKDLSAVVGRTPVVFSRTG